jgi:tungstate transport system ATP-binding protein
MNRPVVLAAEGLCVRRPGWRLEVERLLLHEHETLALLGPNGAGKSTLLQALAALERPSAGALTLDGAPVQRDPLAARRRMAVVLQEPLLVDGSVAANVALGMRLQHVPRHERETRAKRWMDRTGIAHLAGRRARTLSGGEQRRVSLARAFALEPRVLFLDEPFAALDAPTHRSLLTELPSWLKDARCASILVTHDRDDVLHLAETVALLIDGRIRQIGPVDDVFARPADVEVAAFLGVENILHGEVTRAGDGLSRVRVGAAEVVAAAGAPPGPVLVAIHPEMVLLLRSTEGLMSSARNVLDCRVVSVEPAGSQLRVRLDAGFPLVAAITRASAAELELAPDGRVQAAIKATAVHLIARG